MFLKDVGACSTTTYATGDEVFPGAKVLPGADVLPGAEVLCSTTEAGGNTIERIKFFRDEQGRVFLQVHTYILQDVRTLKTPIPELSSFLRLKRG